MIADTTVVAAIKRLYVEWRDQPLTGQKYVHFDLLLKDIYGIDVSWVNGRTYINQIIDEKKFVLLLLKYS